MKEKVKFYPNGTCVYMEKTQSLDVPYVVKLYGPEEELIDKVRTDNFRNALSYFKSFSLIAKGI